MCAPPLATAADSPRRIVQDEDGGRIFSVVFFASCSITTAAHSYRIVAILQYWHRVVFLWTICTTHAWAAGD